MGGAAALLVAEGSRLAGQVSVAKGLATETSGCSVGDVEQLVARLGKAGYTLRPDIDAAALAQRREKLQGPVEGIAGHLGKPSALLLPPAA
jgi:hypothetical protein